MSADPQTIFTIGHGARTLADLAAVLRAAGVGRLLDVRRSPGSRHNPQFGKDALAAALPAHGIEYAFWGDTLGGRRKGHPHSRHPALEHEAFRAYADYMDEPAFQETLARLIAEAGHAPPLAIMCAETLWTRCHRRLIADALVLAGVPVVHLLSPTRREPHRLTDGVRADAEGRPIYDLARTGDLFAKARP
jgi:uncharacterized protein (DUF488 family)